MAAATAARAGPATGGRAEHAMAVASRPDPGGRRPAVAARARNLSVARVRKAAPTATTTPNPIARTRHDHAPFLAPQRPAVGTPGRFAAGTWHRLRVARRLAADRLWQHPA